MDSLILNDLLVTSRILLALDLAIWYIRFLHITLIFNRLGPKLIMLKKMFYDLMFFVVIIVIFVLNYGVLAQVFSNIFMLIFKVN